MRHLGVSATDSTLALKPWDDPGRVESGIDDSPLYVPSNAGQSNASTSSWESTSVTHIGWIGACGCCWRDNELAGPGGEEGPVAAGSVGSDMLRLRIRLVVELRWYERCGERV